MIKNVFKLNGKFIDIATTWDDFTWRQYYRILVMGNDDVSEMVSILTNVPRETLAKATIIGLEQVLAAAAAIKEPPAWDGKCDKLGSYKIPANKNGEFNIQFESLGQFEDMRVIMNTIKDVRGLTEAHPRFCAIYLQKIRDGEYDPEKAREMVEEIKDYPAKEVMTVGSFFYAKVKALLNGTPPSSPSTPLSPKKSKPVSQNSTKNSGRTRR